MKIYLFFILQISFLFTSAQQPLINVNGKGVVIDGYDPVNYFTGGKPAKGNPQYVAQHNSLTYYFVSKENKNTFLKNPSKYEVQFGGFCAYAVSQGHVSPINPNYCSVQKDAQGNERLLCQHNQKANDLWNVSPDNLLVDAYKYWPAVQKNGGKQIPLKGVEMFYINIDKTGLANRGYDVVAYHTINKAVVGKASYVEWFHGAKYLFSTEEHQVLFRNNPRAYLPQYGGFCAYAMSLGKVRPVDPTIFSIENGVLMLQHTQEAYDLFKKDVSGCVTKANAKWPGIEQKRAGKSIKFDKVAK